MANVFGDKIIYFNLSTDANPKDFFSACGGILGWGDEAEPDILSRHKDWVGGYYLVGRTNPDKEVMSVWFGPTDCISKEEQKLYIVSEIIKCYDALGTRFGDVCVDRPLLVRDMVVALRDGNDVDAVITEHLGEDVHG